MRILITGSRSIDDYQRIFTILDNLVKKEDVIIHGGAKGVDSIAGIYCFEKSIKEIVIKPLFPDKKVYYLYRNVEMVAMCEMCIAFWDGKSRGTKFTLDYASQRNKKTKLFTFDKND